MFGSASSKCAHADAMSSAWTWPLITVVTATVVTGTPSRRIEASTPSHRSSAPLRVYALSRMPYVNSLGASGGFSARSASNAASTRSSLPERASRDINALKSLDVGRERAVASDCAKGSIF